MAVIRALRAGIFSDPTMWSSGTVPTAADDVVANNFIVTMDFSTTLIQLRNDNGLGGTTGGYFDFSVSGVSIALTGPIPITQGSGLAVSTILVSHTTGTVSLTTTSAISVGNATANIGVIRHTSAGTFILTAPTIAVNGGNSAGLLIKNGSGAITINGFVLGMIGGASTNVTFVNTGTGTITINGGVNGGTSTVFTQGITNANATIIVNGAVVGGANIAANYAINSTGPIIINGTVTSNGTGNAILANGGATVTGTVTCNAGGTVIAVTNASTVTVTGNVVYGNTGTGFGIEASTNSNSAVTLIGNFTNRAGKQVIFCRIIYLSNTVTNELTFNTPGGASRTLYSDDTFPNLPATTNVRLNITYGPGLTNTGALVVPTPATVLLGVPTDNTTGTLLMLPSDFVYELGNSTQPVAVRLQNCSTVNTTGDQVASYGV